MTGDASILYNAGTAALERGELGQAVAYLLAARRLDARAPDVRRNLAIAERVVSVARGDTPAAIPGGPALSISSGEGWWLAALLLLVGAALGIASLGRPRPGGTIRLLRRGAVAGLALGILLGSWLGASAFSERRNPEAVVVVESVEARSGIDEPPRAPILLRTGERVRTGRTHGDAIEVLLGGSPIGWVPRGALWIVADTPRYTRGFRSK